MKRHVRIILAIALVVMGLGWVGLLSSNAGMEQQLAGATADDGGAS